MWLLNATTYNLSWYLDEDAGHEGYAILSHTWGEDEVSFKDMSNLNVAKRKAGFKKLEYCCTQAWEDGIKFVWVDTCCIDKSSSAELSEAINSMFRWYEKADACYAYLPDVSSRFTTSMPEHLRESRWFTRGWTLQELIAPQRIRFFAENWTFIGTRISLCVVLEEITKIPLATDRDRIVLSRYPAARKLSWASLRATTRPEDSAYCLLGIFDVNMPLIYGEGGKKAFLRLQAEIIKSSGDLSLLLWARTRYTRVRGILSDSAARFAECENVVACSTYKPDPRQAIELIMAPYPQLRASLPLIVHEETALLNFKRGHNAFGPIGLKLVRVELDVPTEPKIWLGNEYVADIAPELKVISCIKLVAKPKLTMMTRLLLSDRRNITQDVSGFAHEFILVEIDRWCLEHQLPGPPHPTTTGWVNDTTGQWHTELRHVPGHMATFTLHLRPQATILLIFRREGCAPMEPHTLCRIVQSSDWIDDLSLQSLDEEGWAWLDPSHQEQRALRWIIKIKGGDEEYLIVTTQRVTGDYWLLKVRQSDYAHLEKPVVSPEIVTDVTGKWRLADNAAESRSKLSQFLKS